MVLRSQKGDFIVNATAIDTFAVQGKGKKLCVTAFCGAASTELGLYSTERQALQVMDKIESFLVDNGAVYRLPEDDGPPHICPQCHNTEHLPGAKFCMICGLAFPSERNRP